MKPVRSIVLTLVALFIIPATVIAQGADSRPYSFNSGIKLRGNFHLNQSSASADLNQSENGYGAGLEIIGHHIGIGLYGFTEGQTGSFSEDETAFSFVFEANYFYPIQRFRIAPYVGAHTGLGTYTKDYFSEPKFPRPQDGFRDLGYQVGIRFKPIPVIGLDAQWRRQSNSTARSQGESLERNQFLVGITLF